MIYKTMDISLSPDAFRKQSQDAIVAEFLGVDAGAVSNVRIFKKSVDARRKNNVKYVVSFVFEAGFIPPKNKAEPLPVFIDLFDEIQKTASNERIIVVGGGCAGLFCAWYLAKAGLKPLLIERGKGVAERQKDIDSLWRDGVLNPESNVQFGLGGAGTFSDGKLTSTAHNKYVYTVFSRFVSCGAPPDIMTDGMPHIGTDNLKKTVTAMAYEIQKLGGNIMYGTKLTDISVSGGRVNGVTVLSGGEERRLSADRVVLATGHSARDVFEMLFSKGVSLSRKPFSVGVRVEHKREMINMARYGDNYDKSLPAATYKMFTHLPDGRGAYTFCMCPGGRVVLGSSESHSIVTNGMSYFARDEENSNSAILVNVFPGDFDGDSPLAGIEFQREMERSAYRLTGCYGAPAQNVADFLAGKESAVFYDVKPSIMPRAVPSDLRRCLPLFVAEGIKTALSVFGKYIKDFDKKGVLTGVETRSSSPVKINRAADYSSSLPNLYPCGEGSGYAGGIVTSAIDGIKCAENIVNIIKNA